jgi:hypothetical protein
MSVTRRGAHVRTHASPTVDMHVGKDIKEKVASAYTRRPYKGRRKASFLCELPTCNLCLPYLASPGTGSWNLCRASRSTGPSTVCTEGKARSDSPGPVSAFGC